MIPGEEVSVRIEGGSKAIHINGIGISRMVEPVDAGGVVPTLQANVNAIVDAGGIASLNHPNFSWAYDHEDISQLTGASLLEMFFTRASSFSWNCCFASTDFASTDKGDVVSPRATIPVFITRPRFWYAYSSVPVFSFRDFSMQFHVGGT